MRRSELYCAIAGFALLAETYDVRIITLAVEELTKLRDTLAALQSADNPTVKPNPIGDKTE